MKKKTNKLKQYTDKQFEHFFQKWLYTYGGASDVVSLDDYIDTYDDWYGPIDEYSDQVCPCILCMDPDDQSDEPNPNADYIFVFEDDDDEDEDEEDIRDESNYLGFDDGGES